MEDNLMTDCFAISLRQSVVIFKS
jgi:sugar lactone lactonase YvrE